MPSQGHHVIEVGAVGPSTNKAYYSNWGSKDIKVSAPGGSYYDFRGRRTPSGRRI